MTRAHGLFFLLFVTACNAGSGNGESDAPAERRVRPPVQTATLVGLYEAAGEAEPSQLCIVEAGGQSRFGLVARRPGGASCSGAGTAAASDGTLSLVMAGDQACRIEARIDNGRVTLPAALPEGCAYYCAPGASLAGLAFDKVGGAEADALRARDLVGDPLCGRLGG